MKKLLLTVLIMVVFMGNLLAQVSPATPKAARVQITQGPELELAKEYLTIIRWTTNNPGGLPDHFGIVRYGTDPNNLSQTAKSPIRLNPSHPSTIFRVRIQGLKAATTYYYTVESQEANGTSDGVTSPVNKFTIP
ncbi:MAG: hypothetical protein JWO71_4347 [Candidatus Acidoferrum typicum]|nr:hypothetical protein [Candidatus Acidoferrum typicum]